MSKRIASVDVLRGIAVVGMVFSAAIGYASGLPGWMFHCQVPPPDYIFDPTASGITWVDMVFPMFIFALGIAIPLSMRRKIDKGVNPVNLFGMTLQRWAILVAFGIVLGNSELKPLIWAGLFAALVRTEWKWLNLAGWGLIALLLSIQHHILDIPFDFRQYDIIIILLARVAFAGGLIWLLTRDLPYVRLAIWLAVIGLKMAGFDWTQYLIIALPATFVGDLLHTDDSRIRFSKGVPAFIALGAVFIQLVGMYNRYVLADGIVTVLLGALCFYLDRNRLALGGFILLLLGIVFDPIDGGIAKDYCNLSYLFLTCGQSVLFLSFLMWLETKVDLNGFLLRSGQNPMIAYTVAWFIICPLLTVCGGMEYLKNLSEGSVFFGILQGVIITGLTVCATNLCTRLKLFWKS